MEYSPRAGRIFSTYFIFKTPRSRLSALLAAMIHMSTTGGPRGGETECQLPIYRVFHNGLPTSVKLLGIPVEGSGVTASREKIAEGLQDHLIFRMSENIHSRLQWPRLHFNSEMEQIRSEFDAFLTEEETPGKDGLRVYRLKDSPLARNWMVRTYQDRDFVLDLLSYTHAYSKAFSRWRRSLGLDAPDLPLSMIQLAMALCDHRDELKFHGKTTYKTNETAPHEVDIVSHSLFSGPINFREIFYFDRFTLQHELTHALLACFRARTGACRVPEMFEEGLAAALEGWDFLSEDDPAESAYRGIAAQATIRFELDEFESSSIAANRGLPIEDIFEMTVSDVQDDPNGIFKWLRAGSHIASLMSSDAGRRQLARVLSNKSDVLPHRLIRPARNLRRESDSRFRRIMEDVRFRTDGSNALGFLGVDTAIKTIQLLKTAEMVESASHTPGSTASPFQFHQFAHFAWMASERMGDDWREQIFARVDDYCSQANIKPISIPVWTRGESLHRPLKIDPDYFLNSYENRILLARQAAKVIERLWRRHYLRDPAAWRYAELWRNGDLAAFRIFLQENPLWSNSPELYDPNPTLNYLRQRLHQLVDSDAKFVFALDAEILALLNRVDCAYNLSYALMGAPDANR